MNKDDIIRMAREAGLAVVLEEHASEYGNGTFENTPYPELERFANLVAEREREACAKLCEEIMQEHDPFDRQAGVARRCLNDIRARGTT